MAYPDFVRALDPTKPHHAALLSEAAGLLRGSGYTAFDHDVPKDPIHAALASTYAHTTAPLRRLVDRYVGEACIALAAGKEIPVWVRTELPGLPEVMEESSRRASQYEAGIVSALEAALLERSVGRTFDAVVVDADERDGGGVVQLTEPAVTARCDGKDLPLGERVRVRLELADVMKRQVRFTLASEPCSSSPCGPLLRAQLAELLDLGQETPVEILPICALGSPLLRCLLPSLHPRPPHRPRRRGSREQQP